MKRYLFFIWIILSLGTLFYLSNLYKTTVPVFTLVWLALAFLAVLLARDAKYVGFSGVKFSEFFLALFLNLLLLSLVFIVLEPLSGTFREVINKETILYPSYYLMNQFSGLKGFLAYFLCNFFIIIFAEELFFRGFLIQYAELKLNKFWGVLIQAFLFLLFILILDIQLPPVQNYIFLVGYTFLGRGLIGGWAAARTDSIWPSLITVSVVHTAVIIMYINPPLYL